MSRPESEWLDAEAGRVVRPYALIQGRTRATHHDLDVIAIVRTAENAENKVPPSFHLGPEHRAILNLCQQPDSVAEISAKLHLPLGVVRVLLDDLLDHELVIVRRPTPVAQLPSEGVLKEVIHGLEAF